MTITRPDGSAARAALQSRQSASTGSTSTPAGGGAQQHRRGIAYDARGQRHIGRCYGNGARTDYRYDPLNFRLIGLRSTASARRLAQDLAYTHDCAGNLTHQEDRAIPAVFFDNTKITGARAAIGYDPLYRLVAAEGREHAGQQANGDFGASDNWDDAAHKRAAPAGRPDGLAGLHARAMPMTRSATCREPRARRASGSYTRLYAYEAATNRLVSTTVGAEYLRATTTTRRTASSARCRTCR